jgi:hypothetical protein
MTEYEWDDDKADTNWRNHKVTFRQAVRALNDHFLVEWIDDRKNYGEERMNLLGMCDGVLLHVTYTERGENIRIISARRAEKHEQENYYRKNAT